MRFCWKRLDNHLKIHSLADLAVRTGHHHTYGKVAWVSVHGSEHTLSQESPLPQSVNNQNLMTGANDGLVFLNQSELLHLANSILYWREKWLFHLLFVSKSQQQALGINMHSGFSNTRQKTSIASAHTQSSYPTFIWGMVVTSWMVRFFTLLYLNSALWPKFNIVRTLLQSSWILSSAVLTGPMPLDQIGDLKTVDSSPSFPDLLKTMTTPG